MASELRKCKYNDGLVRGGDDRAEQTRTFAFSLHHCNFASRVQ